MESARAAAFFPKTWDLPASIRRRLGEQAGRQRLMDEEGHLLLILHEVPKPEDDELRRPFLVWCQPDGRWKSHPAGGGLAALDAHLESYHAAVRALDDDVEAATTPADYFDVMKRAHPLLRSTRHLLAALEAARQARPDERRLIVARDRATDLERAVDLATGDAKAGMEFSMAVNGEAQARAAYEAGIEARRLNRLVAFFFPLATLAAIFGINPPIEVLETPGLAWVVGLGVLAGLLVLLSLPRRS